MSRAPSISLQGSWLPWGFQPEQVEQAQVSEREESLGPGRTLGRKESLTFPAIATNGWLGSWSRRESEVVKLEGDGSGNTTGGGDGSGNEEAVYDEEDEDPEHENGNEIDDHVTKKSSTWSFWNSSSAAGTDATGSGNGSGFNEDRKRQESFSNTILESSHSLSNNINGVIGGNSSDEDDDAVLYKPHSNAKQFQKINTHKNENLRENVIVPNWELCLPHQQSIITSNSLKLAHTLFGGSSTTNNNINNINSSLKLDLANWRHFLSQVSTRLGFSAQSLASVVAGEEDITEQPVMDKVEKEYNLLYEKTYRLYGRSLAKLPENKRACLPNYNRYYEPESSQTDHTGDRDQEQGGSLGDDDADDDGDISISNDPMGNLLINHKAPKKATVAETSIHSIRTGPLTKIKKILIIGVHGFFPTKMVRPFIGSPKGTSSKFANEAEKGVIRYCIENNLITPTESNVSIQKIALELEGKIMDRVEFFTTILKKWSKELNEADFIFVASHSQGCVVSIILLARLISLGILKDPIHKRIGILGMAGINNGPFYGVDKSLFMKAYSAIENESMLELFELNKFNSIQSMAYKELVQIIINANVKLCLIGSINDQLVPLYSALSSHAFHPNIYRACYIDHASQTPSFIQKLVSLCCQLQNLGFFDNNVIKELSTTLAGPLTGSGHSKIYNDGKVYDLGIKFVLDTDDIVIPPPPLSQKSISTINESAPLQSQNTSGLVVNGTGTYGSVSNGGRADVLPPTNQIFIKEYNVGKIGTNPFILPWCFRGLLFNIEKNWPNNNKLLTVESGSELGKNGYDEINELTDIFENWRPDSKLYKDLKYRLNGIRASKL